MWGKKKKNTTNNPNIKPHCRVSTCMYTWKVGLPRWLNSKGSACMQKTWVQSLGWEDPLKKGMATHCSILAGRILWTEEPSGLQSLGLQRVRHAWSNWALAHMWMYMERVWNDGHRTNLNSFPHFLHGEGGQHEKGWSQGALSLSEMF